MSVFNFDPSKANAPSASSEKLEPGRYVGRIKVAKYLEKPEDKAAGVRLVLEDSETKGVAFKDCYGEHSNPARAEYGVKDLTTIIAQAYKNSKALNTKFDSWKKMADFLTGAPVAFAVVQKGEYLNTYIDSLPEELKLDSAQAEEDDLPY